MTAMRNEQGYTLTELLVSVALAGLILVGFNRLISTSLDVRASVLAEVELTRKANFAMRRMVRAVQYSPRLLLPLADNPATNWPENKRTQTYPASPPVGDSTEATAVMAMAIPVTWDINHDGIADGDNDSDGRIDEDLPADANNDGEPGLRGIDDDGNGITDFWWSPAEDDDESDSLEADEDPVNGADDDGDGVADEDPGADVNGDGAPGIAGVDDDGDGSIDEGDIDDDDEDGQSNEDWFDPLVYYMQGPNLIERRPVPWDTSGDSMVTGRDYVESTIADNVALLEFECLLPAPGEQQRITIRLTVVDDAGGSVELTTTVRVGGHAGAAP